MKMFERFKMLMAEDSGLETMEVIILATPIFFMFGLMVDMSMLQNSKTYASSYASDGAKMMAIYGGNKGDYRPTVGKWKGNDSTVQGVAGDQARRLAKVFRAGGIKYVCGCGLDQKVNFNAGEKDMGANGNSSKDQGCEAGKTISSGNSVWCAMEYDFTSYMGIAHFDNVAVKQYQLAQVKGKSS